MSAANAAGFALVKSTGKVNGCSFTVSTRSIGKSCNLISSPQSED
jgi:hypothetical protein